MIMQQLHQSSLYVQQSAQLRRRHRSSQHLQRRPSPAQPQTPAPSSHVALPPTSPEPASPMDSPCQGAPKTFRRPVSSSPGPCGATSHPGTGPSDQEIGQNLLMLAMPERRIANTYVRPSLLAMSSPIQTCCQLSSALISAIVSSLGVKGRTQT